MIRVTTEHYQEQESLRIETTTCSALYHCEGCGFAGLLDRDGADWISYRLVGGEYGHYRGIPNLGLNAFGHPGYQMGAVSAVETVDSAHVRILSQSADRAWQTRWDIYPECAIQTIEATPCPYWWLCEGTPGGFFRPDLN
jgi:hypothetical protein